MAITPSVDAQAGSEGQTYPGQGNAIRPDGVPIDASGNPNTGTIRLPSGAEIPLSLANSLDPETQIALFGTSTSTTSSGATVAYSPTPEVVPTLSYDQFLGYSGGAAGSLGGGGGSGGGGGGGKGGAGRGKLTFDREQLEAQAANMWFALLLQSPDDREIDRLVTQYITSAQAFYQSSGGQKDFETFLREQIRHTEQHKHLYKFKPKGMLEEQYIQPYAAAAAQFGLAPQDELRQTRLSVATGGSALEQAQRISRTRGVMNSGGWSNRMAAVLAGLGPGVK